MDTNALQADAGPFTGEQMAQGNAPIGSVNTIAGSVLVTRADGSQDTLTQGMAVYQDDTVETGPGGAVGLTFTDGTQFSLGAGGRMTLDEMVYDPASSSGSASMTVLTGAFTFVSGAVAKSAPDAMQIKTPVATIGIRGTSGSGSVDGTSLKVVLIPDPSGLVGEIIITGPDGQTYTLNVPLSSFTVTDGLPATYTMSLQEFNETFGGLLNVHPEGQRLRDRLNDEAGDDSRPAPDGVESESTAPEDLGNNAAGQGTAEGGDEGGTPDNAGTDSTAGTAPPDGAFGTPSTPVTAPPAPSSLPTPPPAPSVAPPASTPAPPSGIPTTGGTTTPPPASDPFTVHVIGTTPFDQSTSADNWTITGDNNGNTILTGTGNDVVNPGGGSDTISTGDGNDTLADGNTADTAGNDSLNGGMGNDTYILSGYGTVSITDPGGMDTLDLTAVLSKSDIELAHNGNSLEMHDGDGNLLLTVANTYSSGTLETILSDTGPRTFVTGLTGTAAAEVIVGDSGANTITGNGGNDILFGAGGNDTITGGADRDDIRGGAGDDVLNGLGGNDILNGGGGDDALNGGNGDDQYTYNRSDYLLSGFGDDTIVDTGGTDKLYLNGIDIPDWVSGTNSGEVGTDSNMTLLFDNGGAISTITLVNHYTTGTIESIEISGANGTTSYTLATGETGGAGNEIFAAMPTTTAISAGGGNDIMYIESTNTGSFNGDAGDDTFIFGQNYYLSTPESIFGGTGYDTLKVFYTDGIDMTNGTISGIEEFFVGTDSTLKVNWDYAHGLENIRSLDDSGSVWFDNTTDASHLDLESVILDNFKGNIQISGGNTGDFISGTNYDETIEGGSGNDIIYGNGGNDLISGGEGTDRFAWAAPITDGTVDTITDFLTIRDIIMLDDGTFNVATVSDIVIDNDGILDASYNKIGAGVVVINDGSESAGIWYFTNMSDTSQASYQLATLQGVSANSLTSDNFQVGAGLPT